MRSHIIICVKLVIYFAISLGFQHWYNVTTNLSGGGLAVILFAVLNKMDTSFSIFHDE